MIVDSFNINIMMQSRCKYENVQICANWIGRVNIHIIFKNILNIRNTDLNKRKKT